MTTTIFPTLSGINFPVIRKQEWNNGVELSRSGKPVRVAYWSYPRWHWEVGFDFLRTAAAYAELQKLAGFFGGLQGQYGTFLYQDADDYQATAASISTVGGSSVVRQLQRQYGSSGYTFTEPMFAPSTGSTYAVTVNGSSLTSTQFSLRGYDTTTPGTILFATGVVSTDVITATFQFYFPCMMRDDSLDLKKFMQGLYSNDKLRFSSIK